MVEINQGLVSIQSLGDKSCRVGCFNYTVLFFIFSTIEM